MARNFEPFEVFHHKLVKIYIAELAFQIASVNYFIIYSGTHVKTICRNTGI